MRSLPRSRATRVCRNTLPGLLGVLALIAGCAEKPGDGARGEWPQFRGPFGRGISDALDAPLKWAADSPNVRWKTEIPGTGNSSPVVNKGQIYLTAVVPVPGAPPDDRPAPQGNIPVAAGGPDLERSLLAIDTVTGKILWRTIVFTAPSFGHHKLTTDSTPSPVTDGKFIFAFFGEWLACLDRNGKLIWKTQVDPGYSKDLRYGVGTSPVLTDKAVVVMRDKEYGVVERDTGWIGAFDRKTGKELWRTKWQDNCCSYTTPLVHERDGKVEILNAHAGKFSGYDPETGKELWNFEHAMLQPVSGLVAEGNVICYLGGAHLNRGNVCARISGHGDQLKKEELWYAPGAGPESASPILYKGKIYSMLENGVVTMWDMMTGAFLHQARVEGSYFRGSLVAANGHIYAAATSGHVGVFKPNATNDKFEVLWSNELGEDGAGNNATPGFGGGCLLLRGHGHLFCIEKEKA